MNGLSRRGFFGTAAGAGALMGVGGAMRSPFRSCSRGPTPRVGRRAHNLIFLVADGMSTGTLQLADLYARRIRGNSTRWVELFSRPGVRRGSVDTSAADSYVTDSAAAATAWGIGELVNNRMIGITPDGRMPTPIFIQAQQAGKIAGLVTTARITHATPAAFVANVPSSRDDERFIAEQMLDRRIDVLLGGGAVHVDPLLDQYADRFDIVRTRDELLAHNPGGSPKRLLGLFSRGHMAFEMDREETSQPSLAEMSRVALDRLSRHTDGFVVQIEGGRVDHAAHRNDAAALVRDQIAFDEALDVALGFVADRDDTLVIVTTDHANANPGLTDYGPAGAEGLAKLARATRSLDWARRRIGSDVTTATVRDAVAQAMGVELTRAQIEPYIRWRRGKTDVDPFAIAFNEKTGPLGSALGPHFKVGFVSPNHTSDFVEATAMGPGSELLAPMMRINEIHDLMVRALDLPPPRPVEGRGGRYDRLGSGSRSLQRVRT